MFQSFVETKSADLKAIIIFFKFIDIAFENNLTCSNKRVAFIECTQKIQGVSKVTPDF